MKARYGCGLSEADENNGWVCPLLDPNETNIEDCSDCAFSRVLDDMQRGCDCDSSDSRC